MLINFDGMKVLDGALNFYVPSGINWAVATSLFNANFYATWGCPLDCEAQHCSYCVCTALDGPFRNLRMEKFAQLAGKRGYVITRKGFEHFSSPNMNPTRRVSRMEV